MYTLTDPAKKNYFEGALEPALKYFAQKEEDKLKSDTLEGSIAAANESEMFDSDFAAYEQMAKQLRDSLPEAMKSDVEMKAWEARLAQANAYLESSKAYYTKNYAIYDQNMRASQGANPAELESRGLKDAHSASDYDEEMLMLNNRNMFTITVDENGQFVMNDGTGINDHFDEEHFRQDLVATDIRQPETYWPEHGTESMPDNQEDLEKQIYSKIVNDPLEKINAERWYKDKRGIESNVELNEDQRDEAYRQYAEAAAEDAFKEPEEEATTMEVLLESADEASVDPGSSNWEVVEPVGGNNRRPFPTVSQVEVQESSVLISNPTQRAEMQIALSNFDDSEILESSDDTERQGFVPKPGGGFEVVRTYKGGLDSRPSSYMQPIRFSVSDQNPDAIRIYFDVPGADPNPRYISVEKGSRGWDDINQQYGNDTFLDDMHKKLSGQL